MDNIDFSQRCGFFYSWFTHARSHYPYTLNRFLTGKKKGAANAPNARCMKNLSRQDLVSLAHGGVGIRRVH